MYTDQTVQKIIERPEMRRFLKKQYQKAIENTSSLTGIYTKGGE